MRALMILGVLVVWVLLATPSNSEGTEDGGAEKAMGFEDLNIPAEPTEGPTQQLPCCRRRSKKSCQFCPGSFSFSRLPANPRGITAEEQMMTMNSRDEDLTVERHAKRNPSKKPCCPCSGRKRGCRMMTMNSRDEDLTVERNAKRNRSKKPCCPCSGRKRGCRYCRGSCAIGRSFRGEADAFE